ncbi:PilX N-terminal domain-containing pilus assembly protein [Comamonas sp.]|uniref:pilus assembly PilX family protein n=1 Tax=Comamonas sp. TaxID=34028 RepID=UPI002897F3B0|nr:PilX N-terminal domain-containing pilus assembly protein [Comamonas sp.]
MQGRTSIRIKHQVRYQQRGVALFVVIVFVMLSMLLALWSARTSLFGEMMVSNDADYQRAFEAAQALLQDAELDIRNENADGSICSGTGDVCRQSTADQIPLEASGAGKLLATLDNQPYKCRNGLCTKRQGKQDFWNNSDATRGPTLAQMSPNSGTPVGARYGRYTGAKLGDATNPANPILADRSASNRGGWYWIEVLTYDESSKNSNLIVADDGAGNNVVANNFLTLNLVPNVVYRITSIARGLKPNTTVVLQQTYARQRLKD